MKSLIELNGYSDIEIEYTDARTAGVLFDRPNAIDVSLLINENQTHTLPTGIEINDIVDYLVAQVYVELDFSELLAETSDPVQISTAGFPAHMSLSSSANIYTIGPLHSVSDWLTVKSAAIQLPFGYSGEFDYTATIRYFTDEEETEESVSWTVATTVIPIEYLSDTTPIVYVPNRTVNANLVSVIADTAVFNPIWTLTITPSNTAPINTIATTGTGGTFSFNATTKVATIVGNKTQVNNRLVGLQITFAKANPNFNFTFKLENNINSDFDLQIQVMTSKDLVSDMTVTSSLEANPYVKQFEANLSSTFSQTSDVRIAKGSFANLTAPFTVSAASNILYLSPILRPRFFLSNQSNKIFNSTNPLNFAFTDTSNNYTLTVTVSSGDLIYNTTDLNDLSPSISFTGNSVAMNAFLDNLEYLPNLNFTGNPTYSVSLTLSGQVVQSASNLTLTYNGAGSMGVTNVYQYGQFDVDEGTLSPGYTTWYPNPYEYKYGYMDFILCGAGGKGGNGPQYTSTIAGGGSGGHFVKQTNVKISQTSYQIKAGYSDGNRQSRLGSVIANGGQDGDSYTSGGDGGDSRSVINGATTNTVGGDGYYGGSFGVTGGGAGAGGNGTSYEFVSTLGSGTCPALNGYYRAGNGGSPITDSLVGYSVVYAFGGAGAAGPHPNQSTGCLNTPGQSGYSLSPTMPPPYNPNFNYINFTETNTSRIYGQGRDGASGGLDGGPGVVHIKVVY